MPLIRAGRTVDFRLSPRRDVAAAKAFFRKAMKSQQRCPRTITLDGYAASHRAVRELKADGWLPANTKLRSSKYLNNLIEQDHRGVKQRIAVMLGFKAFRNAAITIAGIELLHRIRKGQFGLGRLGVQGQAAPEVWRAWVLHGANGALFARDGYLYQSPTFLLRRGNRRPRTEAAHDAADLPSRGGKRMAECSHGRVIAHPASGSF
jgi:hypothetical protein